MNESLLAEVLVQGSLLDHFMALRSLLLLHDAHFARALTTNLFGKVETYCTGCLGCATLIKVHLLILAIFIMIMILFFI